MLLNSSVVYRWCLVEIGMTLVVFLEAKMEMSKESEQSGDGKDKWAHY